MTLKTIDLFAGIGGIRSGVKLAALEKSIKLINVFSSEIDQSAIETYKTNFNNEEIAGDICTVDPAIIPDFDLLLAGFPCQPFSQAGLKKGLNDDRGTLFFQIINILSAKKPKAFLLENVKQLKGHDKGKTLDLMRIKLNEIGYTNHYVEVLKARDFGLPQNRERLFIVGFLDSSLAFSFPKSSHYSTRLGDILEKHVDPKYTISDRLWAGHQRRKEQNRANGKGFGYSIFTEDSPYSSTLSARYYKDGSEILIAQENKNPRKITPREAARLQGFPESFKLSNSDVQAYKQLGNSVAIPVVKAIVIEIINTLLPLLNRKTSRKLS